MWVVVELLLDGKTCLKVKMPKFSYVMTDLLILIKVQLHRGVSQEVASANLEPLISASIKVGA